PRDIRAADHSVREIRSSAQVCSSRTGVESPDVPTSRRTPRRSGGRSFPTRRGGASTPVYPRKMGDEKSMRARMLAGELYRAGDPEIREQSLRAMERTEACRSPPPRATARRRKVLTELLGAVGEDTEIRPPLRVDYGSNITIGSGCFANFGLVALDVAAITLGDDVQIGPNVQLLTPTHPLDPDLRRAKWEAAQPITIGDNVWLGGGAIVGPGVTIGENTVVGAGAVVTRDLPPNVVATGVPARVTRRL